jgi:hypothetical protein
VLPVQSVASPQPQSGEHAHEIDPVRRGRECMKSAEMAEKAAMKK